MKLTVNYLGEKFNNKYPYLYRIGVYDCDLVEREQLFDWLDKVKLECTFAGDGLYVKDEATVSFVMLRWA